MAAWSPIISSAELSRRLGDLGLRVVDVRWVLGKPGAGRAAYDAGHLPGAIFLDVDTDLVASSGPGRHPLPAPADLRARLEAAGIGSEHSVVAYDDVGGWVAARLWWMLDDLGHERVSVLDGGLPVWVAEGLPVTTEVPRFAPARLELADRWTNTIDRASLAAGLGSRVLLDARGGPRYRGETEPIDAVPGHIPTARHAPVEGNLGPDGRVLAPAELAARFRARGADGSEGTGVTSCGSGVAACFNSMAMRVAGLPDPLLYPGSYSDWTRAGMPIAIGPEPGEVPEGLQGARSEVAATPTEPEVAATGPEAAAAPASAVPTDNA
jgi:thiosulfate/3-mercaptopyruvate sulfurtransferase